MTADPWRWRHYGQRADDLLRSMEGDFLRVLAEHEAEAGPKEQGSPSSDPASAGTSGASSAGTAPNTEWVTYEIQASRSAVEAYMEATMHVFDHGCETGLSTLAQLGGMVAHCLIERAEAAGWYEIREEGDWDGSDAGED